MFNGVQAQTNANLSSQPSEVNPAMEFFRGYVQLKSDFDHACYELAGLTEKRNQLEMELRKLTEQIVETVNAAQYDPTVPHPTAPKTIGGSQYAR